MWKPVTLEDHLIASYHKNNPGILYLEVPVYLQSVRETARRVDAVLIPGPQSIVYEQGDFTIEVIKMEPTNNWYSL